MELVNNKVKKKSIKNMERGKPWKPSVIEKVTKIIIVEVITRKNRLYRS